jgi:hypothetical protein
MPKPKRHRGVWRPRNVAVDDTRSPMLRLLQDSNNAVSGMVEVSYAQQWPTFFKAQRLGYIDQVGKVTEKGAEFVARALTAGKRGEP